MWVCKGAVLREKMYRTIFFSFHFYLLNCLHCSWSAHCWEKPFLLWEEYLPTCVICAFMWMQCSHKGSNFWFYPLSKELNRQPQTAADQILSVQVRKTCPALLIWTGIALMSHMKEQWKSKVLRLACAYVCIGYIQPKPSLLLRMDQYSWHVLPLCRINSDGEKQPLTASVHTALLRHCMKIDGFDIISKASLSHMPAVEGTGWDQPVPSIPTIAVIECAVFHHHINLFLYGIVVWLLIFTITVSYKNTL